MAKQQKECPVCGKTFLVANCDLKRGKGKFCSSKCQHETQKTYPLTYDQFIAKTTELENGCWQWHGSHYSLPDNYAYFYSLDKQIRAARYGWELANKRKFPPGAYACHHCDNKWCVNPNHIYVGNGSTNAIDMRNRTPRTQIKLTAKEVREIRSSGLTLSQLVEKYGTSKPNICAIRKHKTWKDVE